MLCVRNIFKTQRQLRTSKTRHEHIFYWIGRYAKSVCKLRCSSVSTLTCRHFLELLYKTKAKCNNKKNLQQNTVCLEQQIFYNTALQNFCDMYKVSQNSLSILSDWEEGSKYPFIFFEKFPKKNVQSMSRNIH